MLVAAKRRTASQALRGLRDVFSSQVQYTPNSNVLDIAVDNSLQNRVNAIVSSGVAGTYSGYNVYNEAATGQIYVDIGVSYPRLQQIVPNQAQAIAPPPSNGDCPCDAANCKEEVVQETYWASPTKTSDSDIEVAMQREITVCEPVDSAPTLACADELAQFKAANGINGLRGLSNVVYTARQKKCIDGCSGLPQDQWNKCMDKCRESAPAISTSISAPWKDCYNGCNNKRLSQAELQRCYAACGTTGMVVTPSGNLIATGQNQQYGLVSTMSGLSNDNSIVEEDDTTYVTDPRIVLSQPVDCEKNSNRALWLVVCVAGGIVIGILSTLAWKNRR